jgi:NAD-dependent deacetylase
MAVQYLDMSVERLVELVRERQPCVVLTGAGISTESGIPDFRSAEGIWAQYDPYEVGHIDALRRDPVRVWEFYAHRLDVLGQAPGRLRRPSWPGVGGFADDASSPEPNDGHGALAELEERGWIRAVVTQNVDGLHERAGSREVVEVHGSLREAECVHCGVRVPMADALAQLPLPACPECGEALKPGVVMFGELLPAEAIERAERLAEEAGLLLVVGSSLEVHPVAALPGETLAAGGALAIVNRGGTRWDSRAELVLDAGAGETLSALAAALGMVRPTDRGGAMAERKQDLFGRLADMSEDAIQRLSEAPGADRALQALKGLGDRVDDLQRRTRGFEELEKRLSALEKKMDSLGKRPARAASRKRTRAAAPKSSPPAPKTP